ncbi:hypothetical protein F5883DRAFT_533725 [Diaporthe sp. PMI_573]|nr:hypothetical protein F5883DRAFT_533725 [Diaporthaceae sp. PMI_573]
MQFHRPPELHLLPRAVGDKVQEICLYRSHRVRWDVLPKIFPNLERLVTVFERDAWREEFWSIYPPLVPSEKLPEELGQVIALYKSSLRSLTVTGSLSVNDWRTGKDYRNSGSPGFLSLTAPITPLLSPGLPQVPLIELTADCVWLFGRVDPSVAYQISSLLPSSLVSLHLIDYWAVSIREEGIKLDDEQLSYYPVFPSDLTPLDDVFAILHDSCAAQHTRLKHITLSSPMFDEDKDERWPTLATPPVDRADVQAWQARVGDTFARIGVIFSFTTMRQLETSIKCSWARM